MNDIQTSTEKRVFYSIKAPGGVWIRCKRGTVAPSGWLNYELHDGTVGLKKPGDWRRA